MYSFLKNSKYFSTDLLLQEIRGSPKATTIKKETYASIFAGYDIEVSSINNGNEIPISYIQMIGIGSQTLYTRNIEDSIQLLEDIATIVHAETGGKLLVLVHNLSYEWQHMKLLLHNVQRVFARSIRDVIEVVTDVLVFRCTYAFTRFSLEKLAENFTDVKKAVGDLNYDLARTPNTKLTFREYYYCFYDIEVLRRYYELEYYPNWIKKRNLPLTSTGKVRVAMRNALRRYCREQNIPVNDYRYYLIKCQLTEKQYDLARKCFYGAYTHADYRCVNRTLTCDSFDIGSSYPYCILTAYYPMSQFKWVKPNIKFCETHCVIMDIELLDVTPKTHHHPLSYHKMEAINGELKDNGRIISAKYIRLCVTEVDWNLINQCYRIGKIRICSMAVSERGKLPTFLRKEMMEWYAKKNELKGKNGMEVEYLNRKEYVNSIYGMLVQALIQSDIVLDSNMTLKECDISNIPAKLKEVQEQYSRFYLYQWGVYVTAWARYNLFNNVIFPIEEAGSPCVYSDTDSGKALSKYNVETVFEPINARIKQTVEENLIELGIDPEKGGDLGQVCKENKKPFLFKTLGCKRYVVRGNNYQKATVSGMKNTMFQKYLKHANQDMFDVFNDGMYLPPEWTGKLTMKYRENVSRETLIDYQGRTWDGVVYSGIYAEKQPFSMSLTPEYNILIAKGRRKKL